MPRRRRDGLIEGAPEDDEVEILDLDTPLDATDDDVIVSEPAATLSPLAVLAGGMVAVVALFGLVTAGNTPAPEPPAPSITVPPEPVSAEEAALAAEIAELEATYGVEIGPGPDLDWERVVWNIGTNDFQWVDDGFVGHDAATEWTIRPTMIGVTVSQSDNLALEYPGYFMQLIEGARLLVPEDGAADHVLVVVDDRDPVRFELPAVGNAPTSDLVTPVRWWWDGLLIDDQLVLAGVHSLEIDMDALGIRSGRDLSVFDTVAIGNGELRPRVSSGDQDPSVEPIAFEDIGLSEAELDDLLRTNTESGRSHLLSLNLNSSGVETVDINGLIRVGTVARTSTGWAVTWIGRDAQQWLTTSTDGTTWSTKPISGAQGDVWFSGSRIYSFPVGAPGSIRRSGDLGRTWQRSRRPFASSFDNLAVDDLLIVAEETQALISDEPAIIVTDDYVVTITGAGRSFELSDPATGEVVLSGTLDDSATGLAFDPFGQGLAISDPASGDQLLTVPQGALLRAYAEAGNSEPSKIAITRWTEGSSDPEWRIQSVDEVFNAAVEVEFTVGDGHVLAVVATTQGVDYYVASTDS